MSSTSRTGGGGGDLGRGALASLEDFKAGLAKLRAAFEKSSGQHCARDLLLWELLGCQSNEKAHTIVLRWLFDPAESHGLGDAFLRSFYRRVFGEPPADTAHAVATKEVTLGRDRVDLLIYGRDWRLVIENKIGDQDVDQCERYSRRWPESKFVYLTPDGRQSNCELFKPVAYRVVREVLDELCRGGSGSDFIECFADHIAWDLDA